MVGGAWENAEWKKQRKRPGKKNLRTEVKKKLDFIYLVLMIIIEFSRLINLREMTRTIFIRVFVIVYSFGEEEV